MKKILPFVLVVSGILQAPLNAQEVTKSTPSVECTPNKDATTVIEEKLNDWNLSALGIELQERESRGEIVLVRSKAVSVRETADRANFGKSRQFAFAKALLEAQTEFIELQRAKLKSFNTTTYLNKVPSSTDLTPVPPDQLDRLRQKVLTLTEAQLDNALQEAGVSAEEIEKSPLNVKKEKVFEDSIELQIVTNAMGDVAGLVPLQNFEAVDCENMAAVAVIAVWSQKTLDFARDIVNEHPILADPNRKEQSLITKVTEEVKSGEVIFISGIRKTHDESGYPALLSYGQWSYVKGGLNPREREDLKRGAMIQAKANAQNQINKFLAGTMSSNQDTDAKEAAVAYINVSKSGNRAETPQSIIVEKQLLKMSEKAESNPTGLKELTSWTQSYPGLPDVMLVGTIIAWSPPFANAIGKATGGPTGQAASTKPASPVAPSIGPFVKESPVKNNAKDF